MAATPSSTMRRLISPAPLATRSSRTPNDCGAEIGTRAEARTVERHECFREVAEDALRQAAQRALQQPGKTAVEQAADAADEATEQTGVAGEDERREPGDAV